jgi:hypothetical protein
MNAGIRFIVTANGVIAAVRSTVALMFIQVCLSAPVFHPIWEG